MELYNVTKTCIHLVRNKYGDGAGNTVEENSSVFSLIQMRYCLQCFDAVDWVAGRASGL